MAEITPVRLSELNRKIKIAIDKAFAEQEFWVVADVTNHIFKEGSRYHYFDLIEKDPNANNNLLARISAGAFGEGSRSIAEFERITGQRFGNNISVLIKVAVEFHQQYGLKLNLLAIDSNFTIGTLEQQRRATLQRLVDENPGVIVRQGDHFITNNNRLHLPVVIQRIALVASRTSAGREDFHHTLENNPFGFRFLIDDYHTAVQGNNNAKEFLNCIISVFNSNKSYDAVVVTRGGGAQTDFLIFDNYIIGKAIARFPVPVITGIGHQRNETIADLMAHTQTKTPTKAAEFIIQHNRAFEDAVLIIQKNLVIKSQQLFSQHFQHLTSLNTSVVNKARSLISHHKDILVYCNRVTITRSKSILVDNRNALVTTSVLIVSKPRIILYNRISDLNTNIRYLRSFNVKLLANQRGYLGHFISMIRLMAPDNILKKGFAIIKHKGKVTSSTDGIGIGADIEVILSGTNLLSTVKQKKKQDESEFNL